VALAWRANADVTPCTTTAQVKYYIAKYASRPEYQSASFRETAAAVMRQVGDRDPKVEFAAKFLNQQFAERDYSDQEIAAHLLGMKMTVASREVISVDCRPENEQPQRFQAAQGHVEKGFSVLTKYRA
jgi:hypothetical protein